MSYLDSVCWLLTEQTWASGSELGRAEWKALQEVRRLLWHKPRHWLTESLVTSHHSIPTFAWTESRCAGCRTCHHRGLKQYWALLSMRSSLEFLSKCFNPLQTCEGHSDDFYNYALDRECVQCNNVWWGGREVWLSANHLPVVVNSNMSLSHLGHVMSHTLWGVNTH